jgi:hypothetical protein
VSNKWDAVIQDAERQLVKVNQRAAGLRQTIADFKRMKEEGISWPSTTARKSA